MSHLNPGLISAYNSLTDSHLAGYFSNTRIRRHLQRAGLITRSGRIVPDKEYRHKLIQRAHHRHIRECLAQAIFHKVLEMERVHQIEIKRKLEEFARRERVHKIKVDRSKRYEEEIIRILSPRPPTGARGIRKQHSGPEGEHSESSESPGSSRPNTAPGKMQRPVRLKPIGSNSTTASLRRSSPYRLLESSNENEQTLNSTMEKESRRYRTTAEPPRGISPYCLPVINNFVTPVPPSTKRRERGVKVTPSGTLRGRRLRPTTASSGVDAYEDPPMLRSSVLQSRVRVNMIYFGKTVHLSHDLTDMRDEVKVFQQHCGGENLCVYKGKLREGETFQFISRRHRGFPFSLTFFLNRLQVERLSSCCEFKHRKGSRLGGRHGHFGFCGVEGASPCYKCIIAMGLDKKPTPPPKRVKDDGVREESVSSLKEAPVMETERTADNESECETSRPQDMETEVKEATAAEEDKVKDDYEEDFEADDEGPVEDAEVKKSPSPSQETESQTKEGDASETEDDEKEEDIQSASGSSSSDSEREESDAEVTKEDEKAENIKEVDPEESAVPLEAATEAIPAAPKDSDKQDTAGDSTEIEVCETSVPSANENQQTKSVQEKLAEAILKESQCSSEPELSDTSTEEEEESSEKGPEPDSKDAVAVKSITLTEELQAVVEETKCEEEVVSEAEKVQETSDPKEQEEESEQEPQENKDVQIEEENEKDKNTENVKSEEAEDAATALHPVSEEELAEEDKTSGHQESAKSANEEALEKDKETKEEKDVEVDTQLDETGHGAKSSEEDESSVSEPNQIPDETAAPDDAEAMTASETKEMKAEPSEEREALSCEEAPVTHTETRQQGGSEDAETEGTAENSSSSTEGSGDTTVEKSAYLSEENAKEESSKDDIKEASAVEESKDGVEEEEDDESKTEERIEKEEISSEQTEVDFKDEGNANEEQAEKSQSEEEEVANEEKADELQKTEKDEEDGESVKNKNDEEESEEKGDETIESEKVNTAAGGGKDEEEKDNIEDKSEKDKDEEGSEEKQEEADKTPDREELPETADREEKTSEIMEESEESAGADLDKDNAKISDDNIVESEDVEDSEAESVAQGTETTEETSNNVMEVEKETEEVNDSSEKGQVDVENGEMSTEKKTQEGEGEVQTDVKRDENTETKAEEPTEGESTEGKEVTVKSQAEKPEVDKAPDVAQTEAKAAEDSVEKQEESTENDDPDTSGMEMKDESKSDERNDDEEGSKQDENGNVSEPDSENRDSELMKKSDNVSSHVSEVMVASSGDQAQSPTHTAVDLDPAQKLEVSTAQPDSNTEKHTEENPADHSATDGENGADTEETSKASEEGASVLLQPQTQSPTQNNTEESVAEVKETLEVLTRENNAEMVTNWVTKHQTSKFFETFVEPLEDLKESPDAQLNANEEETQSTQQARAESPLMMAEISQSVNEERDTSKEEPQSSAHSEAGEQSEKDSQQVEETEVKDFKVKPESDKESVKGRDIRSEDQKGSRRSLDKVQEGLMQDDTEQTDVSKTEVESLSGTQHSVTSGRAEGEEKTSPELNEKQANEEGKDLLPLSKTEEQGECSTIPEGLSKLKANETKDTEETLETSEQSREVKEITDFTTSDDGSQEETQRKDIDPQPSDASINGDRRDVQMIEDIKHTLNKDRLSTFSVGEAMFSRSSYPLLTAARTESGH
ncbi:hypothetical protein JOQ06_005659 [Pogonophryne albipinna]|uniref:DUF4590 domain-containing protein n=1 Tax=Pogonophryne albipinna TaxID=1090488 RepID=A0AAD6BFS2_9TELE|nr:hypothetical protein JOQ06_005659 [Pogonophryne albipinna]